MTQQLGHDQRRKSCGADTSSSSSWTRDGTEELSLMRRGRRDASSRTAPGVVVAPRHSPRGAAVVTHGVGSGFGKWMQASYKEAFTEPKTLKGRGHGGGGDGDGEMYDHVYVDVNNVLHVAAHHTKNEEAFFKKLFALLDLTLRRTQPQSTVTLALDGPAPIAKTITQRRRRIRLSSGEKVPLSQDSPRLLKIGLTPGSILSLKIDRALEYYAATRLLSRNALPRGLLFEISGTRVPGEGEVKILRSMKTRVKNPLFKHHSHLIVSEDSDAILLAMTAAPAHTFVLSSKLVFSVERFNQALAQQLPPGVDLEGARRDFVALAMMMGNDYLPASRFGVKYSWRAYLQLRAGRPGPWIDEAEGEAGAKEEVEVGSGGGGGGEGEGHVNSGSVPSTTRDVAWGRYRDSPMFPAPTPAEVEVMRRSMRSSRGRGLPYDDERTTVTAVYEVEGKLAFRHPPPVNWKMLVDFSHILCDPEYVKWQASNGLRPRSDVQRAINAAAAAAAVEAPTAADDGSLAADAEQMNDRSADGSADGSVAAVADVSINAPGVAGVVRARRDPLRSVGRAYEYLHGVGWVLEMYYSGGGKQRKDEHSMCKRSRAGRPRGLSFFFFAYIHLSYISRKRASSIAF